MSAKVFFSKDPSKAAELFSSAGFDKLISPGDEVALKIHFGEPGNTAYLKPVRVNGIRDKVKALAGNPFYTDCNTLYRGQRGNTKDHLKVARDHGFDPVIIPEESDHSNIEINLKHFKTAQIGGVAARAAVLIALTHFKGHEADRFRRRAEEPRDGPRHAPRQAPDAPGLRPLPGSEELQEKSDDRRLLDRPF